MQAKTLSAKLRDYEALTDGEVVTRILAGDHPLFELIMRRYNRRLFRCTRGILNDDGLAQDAMQEAYLNAFRHLQQFRGPDGFGAWLLRITTRAAIRIGRRESTMKLVNPELDPDQLQADDNTGPERVTIDGEFVHRVESAIDRLPRDFRVVFMLRELEGMSIEQTAAILGINPATVKTRLHRAKSMLRERVDPGQDQLPSGLYAFAGRRCDAMVAAVFLQLQSTNFN